MVVPGTVREITGDLTVVELERTGHCGRCSVWMCIGCRQMDIEVDTVPWISVGDRVEVEIPAGRWRAILTVFVLPLCSVLLGAVLGNVLTKAWFPATGYQNLLSIVLALVFVILTFLGVHVYERRVTGKKQRPRIRRNRRRGNR